MPELVAGIQPSLLKLREVVDGRNMPGHDAVALATRLTFRPPELSGRDAEHLTEVTRQVALAGKPHGIRNLRQ